MSGILKRTMFVDVHKKDVYDSTDAMTKRENFHKFYDWALVQTGLGPMAEPFLGLKYPYATGLSANYDPEDEMARIDEIRLIDGALDVLGGSGEDRALNGGIMMTRTGR